MESQTVGSGFAQNTLMSLDRVLVARFADRIFAHLPRGGDFAGGQDAGGSIRNMADTRISAISCTKVMP